MSMATLGLFLYIFLGVRKTFGSMGKGNDIFGIGIKNDTIKIRKNKKCSHN